MEGEGLINYNATTKQCYFNDMDKEKLIKLTKGKVSGFGEKARKRRELKNNSVLGEIEKLLQDYARYSFMEGTIDEDTRNHLVEDAQNYVAKLKNNY